VKAPPQAVQEQSSAVLRAVKKGCWPFLWHIQGGRWYVNKAKRRSRADEAEAKVKELGEATW
jgi:hypothetical protein